MNIQIFGKNKCFDTKKAQRYFKERNIKFQFINLDEKEMSKKEFESVLRQVGIDSMIDPKAKDKELLTMLNCLAKSTVQSATTMRTTRLTQTLTGLRILKHLSNL